MSGIMEIIDERERQTKTKTERSEGAALAIVKVWELNAFDACLS